MQCGAGTRGAMKVLLPTLPVIAAGTVTTAVALPVVAQSVEPASTPIERMPTMRVIRSDARLFRRTGDIPQSGACQADPSAATSPCSFYWGIQRVAGAHAVRWQIATQPFPPYRGGTAGDFNPPGLLAQGSAGGMTGRFEGDFKQLLAKRAPAQRGRQEPFNVRSRRRNRSRGPRR